MAEGIFSKSYAKWLDMTQQELGKTIVKQAMKALFQPAIRPEEFMFIPEPRKEGFGYIAYKRNGEFLIRPEYQARIVEGVER